MILSIVLNPLASEEVWAGLWCTELHAVKATAAETLCVCILGTWFWLDLGWGWFSNAIPVWFSFSHSFKMRTQLYFYHNFPCGQCVVVATKRY